jgi:hypothetical protein
VRQAESAIIVNRLIDCVSSNGKINQEVFNNTYFLNNCGFNSTIIDKSGSYFIKISLFNSANEKINETSFGNIGFEQECNIRLVSEAKKYPLCFNQTIFTTNRDGDLLKMNIIAGSNYEVGAQ